MLNGEVSALHAAVDEVIKFVAWHWAPSPWHLVSIEFPPINISLCFLKTKSKVFKSHNIISPPLTFSIWRSVGDVSKQTPAAIVRDAEKKL